MKIKLDNDKFTENFAFTSDNLNTSEISISDSCYGSIPRVSNILGMIADEGLMNWANAMGRRGIDHHRVSQEALDYGTEVHRRAEILLNPTSSEEDLNALNGIEILNSFEALRKWKKYYGDRLEVVFQELPICGQYFGGTMDLVCKIDGRLTLVDFKTSKVIGYKYFLQLAAYDYLLRGQRNIFVQDLMVLQLNKKTGSWAEYRINLDDPIQRQYHNHNIETFLSMVYTYYSVNISQTAFQNNIYKGDKPYEIRQE